MSYNQQQAEIIELDDSDSDFEIINEKSRSSSSNSKPSDENDKKRNIIEVEDSSNDEDDLHSELRELSVQVDDVIHSKSKGKQRARDSIAPKDTYPSSSKKPRSRHHHHHHDKASTPIHHQSTSTSSHAPQQNAQGRSQLVWIKNDQSTLSPSRTTFKIHGFEEKCKKIPRIGFIHNGIEFKSDDAIIIPHNPPQYALIRSIFSLKFDVSHIHDRHLVHIHYLKAPISTTSPTGRSGELFLRHGQCQDIPIKQILKRRKIDFALIGGFKEKKRGDSKFFCQFVDQPSHSAIREPILDDRFNNCDSCFHRHEKHKFDHPRISTNTLHFGEEKYHLFDFVFIDPKIRGEPFLIGQIHGWGKGEKGIEVKIRKLKRFSEVVKDTYQGFVSKHRLIATDMYENHPVSLIMGKAFIMSSEAEMQTLSKISSFWCCERIPSDDIQNDIVPLQKPLRSCSVCLQGERQHQQDLDACLKSARFPAGDYYSGAGGFLLPGLSMFDWVSAIDTDEAACQTLHGLKRHAPRLQVHQNTVSDLFTYTVCRDSPLNNPKALPAPGSVFLMTGGPPCQGHTRVNHGNNPGQAKDVRNDELWVMLAEVFRVRPYVVILENVSAFKDDKVSDTGREEVEENYGRSAMRELSQNGYSCRLGLIDSRSYGTPQNRLRTFILGVRAGLPLPDFPAATHSNPKITATIFSSDKTGVAKPFYLGRRNTPGTGPHAGLTIQDAISDFPPFEFLPPPGQPRTPRRPQILAFNGGRNEREGNHTRVGFSQRVPHITSPSNNFQKDKRASATVVPDHYTSYVTDGAKKIIFEKSREHDARGCERRATFNEGFSTLLTNSSPGQKGTAVIHPTDRKFTIAERKRAMGWPDWHKLAGTPLDQDRLTGNGVCYESVEAIYLSLVKEVILPWWLKAGKPTEDVFEKFKNAHP